MTHDREACFIARDYAGRPNRLDPAAGLEPDDPDD
jgi:hypothetical protein